MSKPRSKSRLLTHRSVASLADIDTETLRDWVAAGEFPEPKAIIKQTWFYDAETIEHWLETGEWLSSARFKAGVGRGLALERERKGESS